MLGRVFGRRSHNPVIDLAVTAYPFTGDGSDEAVSPRVSRLLLESAGVLTTPGAVFGERYDGYLRFALVVPEERMRDVVGALGNLS
jgi:aspartate/methionine/tyrosine aminotransferase